MRQQIESVFMGLAKSFFKRRVARVGVATSLLAAGLAAPVVAPNATAPASAAIISGCQISEPDAQFAAGVDASATQAQVWRLYQAIFLRQPDAAGLNYWVGVRSQGTELTSIAEYFTGGQEFQNRYGNVSNGQFVQLVYNNVLCRTPDSAGYSYWTTQLGSGSLTRAQMLINFSELREYLTNTQTCHSIFPAESAAVDHCPDALAPLATATLGNNGYRAVNHNIGRANGSTGTFKGVEVDLGFADFEKLVSTGPNRCEIASINANWLVAAEKDQQNPGVLGIGVINGVHVKNSSDRTDRGVFGVRADANPTSVAEVWPGDTLSPDDVRLNSVAFQDRGLALESWQASAETSPYLQLLAPAEIVAPSEWIWATAGVPLRIDGQIDPDFYSGDYYNDPYTYQTLRHTFVAIDKNNDRLLFGGTSTVDARDFLNWATAAGYEDIIKFDGGGSAEYNVGGQATVAGTPRDIPVWFGIGC